MMSAPLLAIFASCFVNVLPSADMQAIVCHDGFSQFSVALHCASVTKTADPHDRQPTN
jgi:hypothetical protein